MREDRCGVCRGDGSSCETVKTQYNKTQGIGEAHVFLHTRSCTCTCIILFSCDVTGYEEAAIIPAGARNIRIEEVAEANNFLAVRGDGGKYYLNGGWSIQVIASIF